MRFPVRRAAPHSARSAEPGPPRSKLARLLSSMRDRGGEGCERIRFSSAILPPYARRSKSLEVLIPILYLKGISTGDFEDALIALLGRDAGETQERREGLWFLFFVSWVRCRPPGGRRGPGA